MKQIKNIIIRYPVLAVLLIAFLLQNCNTNHIPGHYEQSEKGIIAAGKRGSAEAGIQILKRGGNAADAAVATLLALTVTDFGEVCIGSEAACLYFEAKTGKVTAISGVGRSPSNDSAIIWYMNNGIPRTDSLSALVPGIPDLCVEMLREFGTITFEQAVASALSILDTSRLEWAPDLINTFRILISHERSLKKSRAENLKSVSDCFYRGEIATQLCEWYKQEWAFLAAEDLAQHRTVFEKPVSITFDDYTVYKCGTWTQGVSLLQTLKILEHTDVKEHPFMSAAYIHITSEALKLAFADRDKYYGDPGFADVPVKELIGAAYGELRAGIINKAEAMDTVYYGDPAKLIAAAGKSGFFYQAPGTTTCVVADKQGNVAVITPSGWGSTAGPTGNTGIIHGTRMISFNTTPGHPNCVEAGKRPRITLTPTFVLKNDQPALALSVAGGDVQDQTALHALMGLLIYEMDLKEVLNHPRFAINLYQDSFIPATDRSRGLPDSSYLDVNPGNIKGGDR